jgi:hypothetical protein
MGTLYLAHDPVLDRAVALKLFLGDIEAPGARERFVREARATAALSNPNIVTVYDYGDYASQPYIVMEFIRGETLAEVTRRHADVTLPMKLRWMEELCGAVGYAHGCGIIHRDIKPANLMLDPYGRLKVLDFGISRMLGTLSTSATSQVGTPGYCAPEQLQGGEADHRSDLFSIGAVCYEVLTGAEPFGGENIYAVTYRVLHEDPAPLSVLVPDIDRELSDIVAQAVRKTPADRFQTAAALQSALAGVRGRIESDTEAVVRYLPPDRRQQEANAATATPRPSGPPVPRTAVVTPPPEPRRTDREIAARRRVQQFQERLAEARTELAAGHWDAAKRACNEALALDPTHPDAKELLARIEEEAPAPTLLVSPKAAPATPSPSSDDDPTVFLPRPAPAQESTVIRPYPPPAPAPSAKPAVAQKPKVAPKPAPRPPGPRLWGLPRIAVLGVAGVVAVLLVVATAIALWPKPAPPPMPIAVVLDAVPWARITQIERADGQKEALPGETSTPLVMSLVPGSYRVTLLSPPPSLEQRTVEFVVPEQGAATFPVQRFTPMTADQYFGDSGSPATAPTAPQESK